MEASALQVIQTPPSQKTQLDKQINRLQSMLSTEQQLDDSPDKTSIIVSLTGQVQQAKASLTNQMPLAEQLNEATEAHTKAQSAVAHSASLVETIQAYLQLVQ